MNQTLVEHLITQSELLQPVTERLLRAAGVRRGMHVLDLGCGLGDVSILAAGLVGPNGLILGVDHDPAVLETARHRAWRADLDQVYFLDSAIDALALKEEGPFDAVVGRNILSHVADPVATVRQAAGLLRPGGVMAFHEPSPEVMQILSDAGLESAELFGESTTGHPQFGAWARKG
jgi:ubiquinone/menaquinone biosynthesis C-methylase UbiE